MSVPVVVLAGGTGGAKLARGMLDELGLKSDARGNVAADTDTYRTSMPKVYAAGDTRRGQSLDG